MNTRLPVRRAAVMLSLFVAAAAANVAHADEGMVIWKNYDCGYFILQMKVPIPMTAM